EEAPTELVAKEDLEAGGDAGAVRIDVERGLGDRGAAGADAPVKDGEVEAERVGEIEVGAGAELERLAHGEAAPRVELEARVEVADRAGKDDGHGDPEAVEGALDDEGRLVEDVGRLRVATGADLDGDPLVGGPAAVKARVDRELGATCPGEHADPKA